MSELLTELKVAYIGTFTPKADQVLFLEQSLPDEELAAVCDRLCTASEVVAVDTTQAGLPGVAHAFTVPEHDVKVRYTHGVSENIQPGPKLTFRSPERDLAEVLPTPRCTALAGMGVMCGAVDVTLDVNIIEGIETLGGVDGAIERLKAQAEVRDVSHRANSLFFRHLLEVQPRSPLSRTLKMSDLDFMVRVGIWPFSLQM